MFVRPQAPVARKRPARRKSNPFKLFATSALVVSAALAGTPASAHTSQHGSVARPAGEMRFDIAAGPLDESLRAFEAATGLSLAGVPSSRYSRDAALTRGSPVFHAPDALTALSRRHRPRPSHMPHLVRSRSTSVACAVGGGTRPPPTVDSPKLTEPLRDIPQTITVIPRAVIEEQGATTLRDVLRNVAGITFQAGEGGVPAGDELSIRGFSARTDMFVDGVRDFGGYARDSFNMEQVEVAKGPTSALAGRGSTGGAIDQVSKSPVAAPVMDATFGAGTASYQRSTIDINQPLDGSPVPGTAVRLNAMWTDTDVPNRDVVTGERWGLAPSLALGVGSSTRANVSYFKLKQDNIPEYGLPWVPVNTNPDLVGTQMVRLLLTNRTSTG